ncbi:hypothetical protein B0H13DRAFT_1874229 [Mycena leptocephala]|nr:hypothetical protein B0H13DRAFT_1874229 [Mycena leptocephala]
MTRVPNELVEVIVQEVGDAPSLKACSLVGAHGAKLNMLQCMGSGTNESKAEEGGYGKTLDVKHAEFAQGMTRQETKDGIRYLGCNFVPGLRMRDRDDTRATG